MQFRSHTLDNGLEIVAECNENAYSAAFGFFVKTGARDENDAISGVSHFLEHMVFKGTPTRTAADVNRELDEIGANSNAFTSEEQTVYFATVLPEYQDRAIDLLSDIMRPSLRADDFNVEKKVILEEIAKYEDQPPFGAHEKCMAAHFGEHPLARSVLGTAASVGALTPEQMLEYFQQRYSPGNLSLVAAGNVHFDRLVELAERRCGPWARIDCPRDTPRAIAHSGLELLHKENAVQQYTVRISNGPAAGDDDRYAARLLATVLGDDSGSRMYWEFVDSGLAEYAVLAGDEYQGTGVFFTFLACQPETTAQILERIDEIFREAERGGVTEQELMQAKSKICSHAVLRSERPSNRLFEVGDHWIQRREYLTVRETVDAYQAVTRDDVAAVLARYPLNQSTTVSIGPLRELTLGGRTARLQNP